jgi:hypothetical protein
MKHKTILMPMKHSMSAGALTLRSALYLAERCIREAPESYRIVRNRNRALDKAKVKR